MKNILYQNPIVEFKLFLRIMKLSVLALFLFVGTMFATETYSQSRKVTIVANNISINKVLRSIEKQTDYLFVFNAKNVNLNKSVNVNMHNRSVAEVLDMILRDTDINYAMDGKNIMLRKNSIVQVRRNAPADDKKKISGVVKDISGMPIIGASVSVKGTSIGVITDINGKFSFESPSEGTLNVSYMGFKNLAIPIKGKSFFSILLQEDIKALDEIVVIGYGTQKKVDVTGAIAQVNGTELKTAPSGNLTNMLAGRLPGLVTRQNSGQPGADASLLYIRGSGAGDGSPLIVIDGVIADYFPNFTPDEIESITILKDASAAIYGVRASAGVILVTTKHGSIQKPTVTLNSSITLTQNTNFPKFLNGLDYATWYNRAQQMDGVDKGNYRFTDEELERIKNGDPELHTYSNTDWFDLLFQKIAPIYTNNISVSGGSNNIKFYTMIGAYNQKGIIKHTSYDRYNFRANMDAKVTDNIDFSFNLSGNVAKEDEPGAGAGTGSYASILQQALLSYPYLPAYTSIGTPVGSINQNGNGNNNPLAARDLSGKNNIKSSYFQGNMSLKYKLPFIKGLSFKFDASYVKNYKMQKKYFLPYDLACWNQSTREWTTQTGRIASKVSLGQWFTETEEIMTRPTMEYSNTFGKHTISGMFLYEYSVSNGSSLSGGRTDYPITDIIDMDFGLEVDKDLVKGGHTKDKRGGYVFRLNYGYNEKYLFEFTGRIDASTALPAKYRWGFFPNVSFGWRISEEKFFKKAAPFIDNMKLRVSAGRLGSDRAISNTMTYFSTATLSKDPVVLFGQNAQKYMSLSSPTNPLLKWELTDSYNVGLETSMWNGLLGVEMDLFYMKTTRSLDSQSSSFPPSLGSYYSPYINYGSHDNRGFELVLSHHNRIKDFVYNIRGNVSWARNKVIKSTENPSVPLYERRNGRPMGEYLGFKALGLFQSDGEIAHSAVYGPTLPGDVKLKDINGDGKITWDQDLTVIGRSSIPEMMFGLNLNVNWKGVDFNALFQGAAICDVDLCGIYSDRGGIRDNTFYTRPFYADGNSPYYLVEGSWRPDNTNAKYPRLGIVERDNGGKNSSWWVKDGAYIRLKTLQIGYTLPIKWCTSIGLKSVRTYISGSNLLTLSHLKYFDPEMPSVNQGYYPQQRTYEFGLNMSF